MMLLRSMGGLKGENSIIRMTSDCNHGILVHHKLNTRKAGTGLGATRRHHRSGRFGSGITTSRTIVVTSRLGGMGTIVGIRSNRSKQIFNDIATGSVYSTIGRRCKFRLSGGGVELGGPVEAAKRCSIRI